MLIFDFDLFSHGFIKGSKTRSGLMSGIVLGVYSVIWIVVKCNMLGDQSGFLEGTFQVGTAVFLFVSLGEAAKRAIEWPL